MQAVHVLIAGVRGAEEGTARIFRRGTSTRATVYGDFEASTADSSGADIELDADGSAIVYVNELVEVFVYSSEDVLLRQFVAGEQASAVEVTSNAFTGTSYSSGQQGPGRPVTLSEALDRWLTSAGTTDFNVAVDGEDTRLQDAFGILTGLYFNVKSPAYGAIGNGVAIDQAAVVAAHDAAVAAGGGTVFFPVGTYLLSSAIEWNPIVNILGSGVRKSVLVSGSASNANILTFTSGSPPDSPMTIEGIAFSASQVNSGSQIFSLGAEVNIRCVNAAFGISTNCTGALVDINSGGDISFESCTYGGSGAAAHLSCHARWQLCRFATLNTAYNAPLLLLDDGVYVITDCQFDASAVSNAVTDLRAVSLQSSSVSLTIRGCEFVEGAREFTSCLELVANARVIADGNLFADGPKYSIVGGVLGDGSRLEMAGYQRVESNVTTLTMDNGVELLIFQSTGLVPTITLPTKFHRGQIARTIIMNDSGAPWATNIEFTGDQPWGTVDTTAVDGQVAFCDFIVADVDSAGFPAWVPFSMKLGSA